MTKPSFRSSFVVCVMAVAFGLLWRLANAPSQTPTELLTIEGVAYTPYVDNPDDQNPPDDRAIRDDLTVIHNSIERIRLYSVTGAYARVARLANEIGLKVDLGAWIGADRVRNEREMAAMAGLLEGGVSAERILIGNEAILREDQNSQGLLRYIEQVREKTNVPVGTAEPWHVWMANPSLVEGVDFIGVQLLPYWEGLPVADAASYAVMRLRALQGAYPGKPIVVTEIGWPSHGRRINGAVASLANQARFLRDVTARLARMQVPYFVIEAFDRPWKIKTEGAAGGYWGLWDAERVQKFAWRGAVYDRPAWAWWASGSVGLGVLLSLALGAARSPAPASMILTGLAQGAAMAAMWSMMIVSMQYATPLEALIWRVLIVAQWFLLLVLLVDGLEMTDRLWGRRRSKPEFCETERTQFPKISIHVPCSSEPPDMVCETLRALAALNYPNFDVIVIDNNTRDADLWRPVAAFCATLGDRFTFYHLDRLAGFKAGALNFALTKMAPDAELIAVIDSDYIVDPDWLLKTSSFFTDDDIGFVQAPQDYRDGGHRLFKRFCLREFAAFFHIGMVRRDQFNAIIQHGVMTLMRREALVDAGGWSDWCITEDAELGLRLHARGWKSIFVSETLGRGLIPNDFGAYKAQRRRWVYGAMRILRRHWRMFLRPGGLSWAQRFQYTAGWLPWVADAVGLVFTAASIFWTAIVLLWPESFSLPPWVFPAAAIGVFCLRQIRDHVLYAQCGPYGVWGRLGASFAGLALGFTIGKAVFEGFVAPDRPFIRTPKDATDTAPSVRETVGGEVTLLLLLTVAIAGSIWRLDFTEASAVAWVGLLVVQSTPYFAALGMAVMGIWKQDLARTLKTSHD